MMDKSAKSTSALLDFAIILVGALGLVAAENENTLAWDQPASWQTDGMWSVTSSQNGLQFLKDKKPAHNSICWLTLQRPLRRGQGIEITYRMEVPYKHVDMFVGRSCAQAVYGKQLGDHVIDLVNPAKVAVQESNGQSVFAVRLKPGEGGIFSLGVKLP